MESHLGTTIRDILSSDKSLFRPPRKSDKRAMQRFDLRSIVRITIDGVVVRSQSYLRNLSTGGVGMMCRTPIAVGRRFSIELPYADETGRSFRDMSCESVRCVKAADGVFLVAARFIAKHAQPGTAPAVSGEASGPVAAPAIGQPIQHAEIDRIRAAILGADAA